MKQFTNTEFLKDLSTISTVTGTQVSDSHFMEVVKVTIKHYGYDEKDVFTFFKSVLVDSLSESIHTIITKKEWEKIYNTYNNVYPQLGQKLMDGMSGLNTPDEFMTWFMMCVEDCGLDPDVVMTQTIINTLGWGKFITILYKKSGWESITLDTIVNNQNRKRSHTKKRRIMAKKIKSSRKRAVIQFDNKGVELGRFNSTMDAERETKVSHSNISACLKGRVRRAGGYVWRYVGETFSTPKMSEAGFSTKEKPVWVYTIDGKLYGSFRSQKSAAQTLGVPECNVSKNLIGLTKTLVVKMDDKKERCYCKYQPESTVEAVTDIEPKTETPVVVETPKVEVIESPTVETTPVVELTPVQNVSTLSDDYPQLSEVLDERSLLEKVHSIFNLGGGKLHSSKTSKTLVKVVSDQNEVEWKYVVDYIILMLKKSNPTLIEDYMDSLDWEDICKDTDGPVKEYLKTHDTHNQYKELFHLFCELCGWDVEDKVSEYIIDSYGWDNVVKEMVILYESYLYEETSSMVYDTHTVETPIISETIITETTTETPITETTTTVGSSSVDIVESVHTPSSLLPTLDRTPQQQELYKECEISQAA